MQRESLPIDDALPEIVEKLRTAGAIVLKAEPGAGKTTRVPPAVLSAGLGDLTGKTTGQIILLQPRRVAARTAAARISEERGSEVGEEIGYQVRQEGRHSKRTRILVCTEGVFLRRLQDDPLLENVAAVIFDEFHERTIDSDVALALCRQVREQVRPDLRIIVMSATLAAAPIAAYLGNCPTVEIAGRTHPIELEYLKFPAQGTLPQTTAEGITSLVPRTDGHVLAFLPGVGEIRQAQEILESTLPSDLLIMPLYGDMSLEEQQQVLRPTRQRKVILSTNVAETSLTINGVTAVVDSGFARVNRFYPQLGLNRLETERISRASAAQRAGRAGRTAPGQCLRMWTERDQLSMREFDTPEIARVELSQSILQLIAWGESDVGSFPWFESPPAEAIERALQLLHALGVLHGGKLTNIGAAVAKLPLQPRLSRLIVEGVRLGTADRAALCAALMSERDPFRRGEGQRVANHHTDSDVLDRVIAIEQFDRGEGTQSVAGTLMSGAAKQVIRTWKQLSRVCDARSEEGAANSSDIGRVWKSSDIGRLDEAILRCLFAAFPDRLCKLRASKDRRAVMVGGRGVKLAQESGMQDSELLVAVELLDSGQAETFVKQGSHVERKWLPEEDLTTTTDVFYDAGRQRLAAMKRVRYFDLVIEETFAPLPADADLGALLAAGILANLDLNALIDDNAKRYLLRVQCLRQWIPELALPEFTDNPWQELLPDWCMGATSVCDLTAESLIAVIRSRLSHEQTVTLDKEAPESLPLPNGRRQKLEYEAGKPPILAARIQDLFGMTESPRIARGRISVLMHLLAPNYRVQQITPDLSSFWKNTYPEVKKELKGRYPKHAWPDDPLTYRPEPKSR